MKKTLNFALLGVFSAVGLLGLVWFTQPDRINADAGITALEPLIVDHIRTEQI